MAATLSPTLVPLMTSVAHPTDERYLCRPQQLLAEAAAVLFCNRGVSNFASIPSFLQRFCCCQAERSL
jgi:hypothetical protein